MPNAFIHPSAQREYQGAVGWYQERSRSAAERFVAEVELVLERISAQPEQYAWLDDEFREAGLRRYPYTVIYQVQSSGDVWIVAVAHTSREPGYWRYRVSN